PIFCRRSSSRRARTALLPTTPRSGAGGRTPERESWRFRSASNPIPKAGLPATTLTTGAVDGGRCRHRCLGSVRVVFSRRADELHTGGFSSCFFVGGGGRGAAALGV